VAERRRLRELLAPKGVSTAAFQRKVTTVTLRLVRPPEEGQDPTRPPERRRYAPRRTVLTSQEKQRVGAALRNAITAYGSASCLAEVMDVGVHAVRNVRSGYRGPSLAFTARLARATGTTAEALLSPGLLPAEACPHCGATRAA
jgi:hypothetical protein